MKTCERPLSFENTSSHEEVRHTRIRVEMGAAAVSAVEVRTAKLSKEQEALIQAMPDSSYYQQHLRYQFGIDELPDDRL